MRGFGFGGGRQARRRRGGNPVVPALDALSLAASGIVENSAAGTVVGGVLGSTAGSMLTLTDTAGGRFALLGGNLVAGATATDYETATSHGITIRETLAGDANSPRDTVLTVTVVNIFEQPTLATLSLAATSFAIGAPASGGITGATAGSTIAASGLPGGLTINGPARTFAWSGSGTAGSATVTLTETLADSANSPRASSVGVTIAAAAVTNGIVYDGDSITEGPNQNWFRGLPARPAIFASITGRPTVNLGVSGRLLQDMDATFATRGVAGYFSAASTNTLVLLGGINDIINNAATLAQLQGWMTSYCGKAVAAGFRLFVGTILPTAYPGWTAAMETVRTGFNSWLKANRASLGLADVIDYAAIPEAADPTDTAYYFARLHPYQRLLGIMSRLDAAVTGVAVTQLIVNPDFATGTGGWFGYAYNFGAASPYIHANDAVMTNPSGRLRITCVDQGTDTYPEAHLPLTGLVNGASYTFGYELVGYDGKAGSGGAGGGARIRVASVQGQSIVASGATFAYSDSTARTVAATYTGTFTATAATMFLVVQNYSQNVDAYVEIDNVTLVRN